MNNRTSKILTWSCLGIAFGLGLLGLMGKNDPKNILSLEGKAKTTRIYNSESRQSNFSKFLKERTAPAVIKKSGKFTPNGIRYKVEKPEQALDDPNHYIIRGFIYCNEKIKEEMTKAMSTFFIGNSGGGYIFPMAVLEGEDMYCSSLESNVEENEIIPEMLREELEVENVFSLDHSYGNHTFTYYIPLSDDQVVCNKIPIVIHQWGELDTNVENLIDSGENALQAYSRIVLENMVGEENF